MPKESSIVPLVRLYLPGCLTLLKGGANAQTIHLPVERDELVVDAVAVRSGRGKLYVTVHDMHDADKIGTAPGDRDPGQVTPGGRFHPGKGCCMPRCLALDCQPVYQST
jgi:hypothetical protein